MRKRKFEFTVANPTERSAMKVSSVSPLELEKQETNQQKESMVEREWESHSGCKCFVPSVTCHYTPSGTFRHFHSLDAFGYGTDLIHLIIRKTRK